MNPSKAHSSYEEFMQDEDQRILLEREYKTLLISEFLIALSAKDGTSVRRLAIEIGISPTVVHELRTGKHSPITLDTLSKILDKNP